jgi:cytoskeleton protein RodZ
MSETGVGAQLRAARERRGLTLDEVAAATHIRARYLEALEREDWAALPPKIYAVGFLKLYARQLGLDGDALAARLAPPPPVEPAPAVDTTRPPRAMPTPTPPRRRRAKMPSERPPVAWAVGVVGLALALGAVLVLIHHAAPRVATAPTHHAAPSGRAVRQPAPRRRHHGGHSRSHPRPPSAPALVSASPSLLGYQVPAGPITVQLTFTSRCWVEEWIDGVNQGRGGVIFNAGQTVPFHAAHSLMFYVGNPRAVTVVIDGTNVGLLSQGTNGAPRTLSVTVNVPVKTP